MQKILVKFLTQNLPVIETYKGWKAKMKQIILTKNILIEQELVLKALFF